MPATSAASTCRCFGASRRGRSRPSIRSIKHWSRDSRQVTTVPGQALYLLNSSFVRRQALALAERLLDRKATDEDRIRALYRVVLGRLPNEAEVERSRAFLAEYESAQAELDGRDKWRTERRERRRRQPPRRSRSQCRKTRTRPTRPMSRR